MKNLQDNPSIAIIVPFNGDVEMYHPFKKLSQNLSEACVSCVLQQS